MRNLFTPETWQYLRTEIVTQLPRIASGIVVILFFWLAGLLAQSLISRIALARKVDPTLVRLMAKAAHLGLITFGFVTGLGTMGIDIAALVAGLGLTGFALGFALKDIVSNLLAGVLVILYRTFDEGDRIKVAGFEGRVRTIDLRYTLLDTENETVFLPNQLLFNNAVVVVGSDTPGTSEASATL